MTDAKSNAGEEELDAEQVDQLIRERDAYVKDALEEEGREHDIRWTPPGDEDEAPEE